jgi:fatty acid desaturase
MSRVFLGSRLLRHRLDVVPVSIVVLLACAQMAIFLVVDDWPALAAAGAILTVLQTTTIEIAHNHYHCQTFTLAAVNRLYEVLLFWQCGMPSGGWTLHHNVGHHRHYLNQAEGPGRDENYWMEPDGTPTSRGRYTIRLCELSYVVAWRNGRHHPALRRRFAAAMTLHAGLLSAMLWLRPAAAVFVFLIPVIAMMHFAAWVSYAQHAGLATQDELAASFNYTSHWKNVLTFNHGYHTAHHLKPGLHWSELPAFHATLADRIPPACIVDAPQRPDRRRWDDDCITS